MRKFMSVCLALVILLSSMPTSVHASENDIATKHKQYCICYSEDGKILFNNLPVSISGNARAEDGTYLKTTTLGQGSEHSVYLGYHPSTNIWRSVSSYTFSESVTVGMSVTVSGTGFSIPGTIGISASVSSDFSFTITVDQSRQSKIRVYCDYDYIAYHGEVRDIYTDELLDEFDYVVLTKTSEDFRPVYKS